MQWFSGVAKETGDTAKRENILDPRRQVRLTPGLWPDWLGVNSIAAHTQCWAVDREITWTSRSQPFWTKRSGYKQEYET